ncbi:unnamed protein product [Colias eurytheme]|nr:unnamed protein product [Colias eurytheme]
MKLTIIFACLVCVAIVEAQSDLVREILKRKIASILARRLAHDGQLGESSRDYARGRHYAGRRYDNGASGAEGSAFHNAGRREFHNIGHHHSKVVQVTKKESSESHNIGGSEAYDNAAAAGRRYHKHHRGASEDANDFSRGQDQSISA